MGRNIWYDNGLRKSLPFEDKVDFEEAKKGFIASPNYKQIMAEAGNVAWDMGSYDYLLKEGENFDSINPSLQRQAILNMAYTKSSQEKSTKSVVLIWQISVSSKRILAGLYSTH